MAKKPSVNPDYVCFYKKSAFVHGLTSTEIDDMWLRISDDHNCDTFYFSIVQSMSAFSDMIRRIFRLDWKNKLFDIAQDIYYMNQNPELETPQLELP